MEHNDNTHMPAISRVLHRLGLQDASRYSEMQEDQLIQALNSPDSSARVTAVHMLGEQEAPTELLFKAIQDEHASVRAAAIQTLGKRGGYIPIEPLIAALQHDPEWTVRAMAALTLRTAGAHIPIEPLLDALHDEDESVRTAAARALGAMGERVPLQALEDALHDPAWPVREAAALTLGELGRRVPAELLLSTTKDSDASVREAAGVALQQVSPAIFTTTTSGASLPRQQRYPRQGALRVLRLVLLYCWSIFIGYLGSSIWNLYQLTHANPAKVTDATVATAIATSFAPLTSGNIPLSLRVVFAVLFVLLFFACLWAARDIWHERRSMPIRGTQANRFTDRQEKNDQSTNAQNHHRANMPVADHQSPVFAKRRLSRRVITVSLATVAIAGNSIIWSLLLHSLRNRQPPAEVGGSKSISFYGPGYSALDAQGNLYVLDADLQNTRARILELSPSGDVLAEWPFKQNTDPACIEVDGQGNIYLAVQGTNSIYTLSPTGALLPKWHVSGARPTALALDRQGNIYVAFFYENAVQKYSSTGTLLKVWGTLGSNQSQFYHPAGVAVDGQGNVYVTDQGNARIQKLAPGSEQPSYLGNPGNGPGQFLEPAAIAIDSQGNVYVTDGGSGLVQKFSSTGKFLQAWGTGVPGSVQFGIPRGIAVDAQGNIYVSSADSDGATFTNGRITVLSPTGKVLAVWK